MERYTFRKYTIGDFNIFICFMNFSRNTSIINAKVNYCILYLKQISFINQSHDVFFRIQNSFLSFTIKTYVLI